MLMFARDNQDAYSAIAQDKMEHIIDCILQGKYSSACLLLLEATGHNPLHYIPYRTYNRLQKQRQQAKCAAGTSSQGAPGVAPLSVKMDDLDYVEPLEKVGTARHKGRGSAIAYLADWSASNYNDATWLSSHLDETTDQRLKSTENLPSWHVLIQVA